MQLSNSDREEILDRQVWRHSNLLTSGVESHHVKSPVEILIDREEAGSESVLAESDREALRAEILDGLIEYFMADGPDPYRIHERLEGAFRSFRPDLLSKIGGGDDWIDPVAVHEVLSRNSVRIRAAYSVARGRGALSEWWREIAESPSEREVAVSIVSQVLGWLFKKSITTRGGGDRRSWRSLTACVLGLVKAMRPHLIGSMSLEDLAVLSGDPGGRGTPSARIRRLYNEEIDGAGMLGSSVHFQKSPTTCAKCSAAQIGNANRALSVRRRRRRKPPRAPS